MVTIKQLYEDAMRFEQSFLIHYIYCLLQEGKIGLEDDLERLNEVQVNADKLKDILERNVMGISNIKIYSLKMDKREFAFIFAEDPEQAKKHFQEIFRKAPINCHEYSLDIEMARGRQVLSIREMRKEHDTFPALAFVYEKPNCY